MADSDTAPNSSPEILASDLELIDSFIRGKKKSSTTAHLQIEYGTNTVKLLDLQKNIVGVSKQVDEWRQKILLQRSSRYLSLIQKKLSQSGFFPVTESGHPDFLEYHKYQTPSGFSLHHQPGRVLGQSWLNYNSKVDQKQPNNILVFQNSNWYPIQELNIYQQSMRLRTLVGEVMVGIDDLVVWIEQVPNAPGQKPPITVQPISEPVPSVPLPPNSLTMSPIHDEATKSAELTSVFKTPIVPTSPEPADEMLNKLKNSLRIKALAKLVDYLEQGEKIVSTEVLKNGHGQTISTKTTEVERNCPRWVIEQVKRF